MSHFYGKLKGSARTEATRCGTERSGMIAQAAGLGGAIEVHLTVGEDGKDHFAVRQITWRGRGIRKELCEGVIGE